MTLKLRKWTKWLPTVAFILFGIITSCSQKTETKSLTKQPNILLIVADDLGYADLGYYGGDIETPNIDALAASGIAFSRFHTGPSCAPTRAMMLSGNDNHIAGIGLQGEVIDQIGYEGRLTDRIVSIPEVLGSAGYHTYLAGKWHLGGDSIANPKVKGFERSFVMLPGAGNHYNDQSLFSYTQTTKYTENGQPTKWPNGEYSTSFYTDKVIEYIGMDRHDDQPFFAMTAYTSPHWPLQVDEEYWRKYEGRYDAGYEKLKEDRLQSLIKAGMVPVGTLLPPNHDRVKSWKSLTPDEQKKEARKMELYAGMLDNLDVNVGRLVAYLKKIGEFDNTIILFMSDNGAAADDFYYHDSYGPFIRENFNDDYDKMGTPDNFVSYGPQWAEAGSSPFRYFKAEMTEGALIAPMIISGPGIDSKGTIYHEFATVLDIAPTFYELASASYPEKSDKYPMLGESMVPIFSEISEPVHDDAYVFGMEHANKAMLRKGDWKIVNTFPPFDEENFELFNLESDVSEMVNLKETNPEKYNELITEWRKFEKDKLIQFPTPK